MDVLIYGAGGHAREMAWLASECGAVVLAFIDDHPSAPTLQRRPVMDLGHAAREWPKMRILSGIGYPAPRRTTTMHAVTAGLRPIGLIHPRVERSATVEIAETALITAGCIITDTVRIGEHTCLNLGVTVSHDCRIGDYCTLSPGVHIAGNIHMGNDVFVGIGAIISNGTPSHPIRIGDRAIVGAGAVVLHDVPANTTVVGVPARPLRVPHQIR